MKGLRREPGGFGAAAAASDRSNYGNGSALPHFVWFPGFGKRHSGQVAEGVSRDRPYFDRRYAEGTSGVGRRNRPFGGLPDAGWGAGSGSDGQPLGGRA